MAAARLPRRRLLHRRADPLTPVYRPQALPGQAGRRRLAVDVASGLSLHADAVFLATRCGAHIIPKYVKGRPLDAQPPERVRLALQRLPFRLRSRLVRAALRNTVGDYGKYGLPEPDHPFLGEHPTISDTILSRIIHGRVVPKPTITRLDGDTVHFADGTHEVADVVVYATGYKVTFPFFDPDVISAPGNVIDLYRRVFHPDVEGVYFLALLQPLGATMPLAEAQRRWLGEYLRGRYLLPRRRRRTGGGTSPRSATRCRWITTCTCGSWRTGAAGEPGPGRHQLPVAGARAGSYAGTAGHGLTRPAASRSVSGVSGTRSARLRARRPGRRRTTSRAPPPRRRR